MYTHMTHIKNVQKHTHFTMCINSPLSFHVGQENCTSHVPLQLTVSVQCTKSQRQSRGKRTSYKEERESYMIQSEHVFKSQYAYMRYVCLCI